ncbi:MAG: S1 RNA-binding domain-containing protein, partial [Actinomycetia bacterium]|nr:S1 RNA-binding domain-containing protein [Actinomycetes bacterium]
MQEESMKNSMEFYEDTLRSIEEGEIIQGTVLKIDKEEIFVDVGYKSEGVIPAKEFYCESSKDIFEVLSIGDPIEAIVIQSEDNEGRLILSKRKAVIEKAWRTAESARITGDSITGIVHEVVKGGLLLDIGVRAFLPASLIDVNRVSDLSSYIGQEFECKVINTNRFRKSIVLSRKACLEEGLEQERKDTLEKFDVGQRM